MTIISNLEGSRCTSFRRHVNLGLDEAKHLVDHLRVVNGSVTPQLGILYLLSLVAGIQVSLLILGLQFPLNIR